MSKLRQKYILIGLGLCSCEATTGSALLTLWKVFNDIPVMCEIRASNVAGLYPYMTYLLGSQKESKRSITIMYQRDTRGRTQVATLLPVTISP